jgi:hypothetical protein
MEVRANATRILSDDKPKKHDENCAMRESQPHYLRLGATQNLLSAHFMAGVYNNGVVVLPEISRVFHS